MLPAPQTHHPEDGFRVPPIPATPGRTQPTPRASRSVGAELTGELTSIFGIWCSHSLTGRYPNGHLLARYVTIRQTPRVFWIFLPSPPMARPNQVKRSQFLWHELDEHLCICIEVGWQGRAPVKESQRIPIRGSVALVASAAGTVGFRWSFPRRAGASQIKSLGLVA